ncbi:MAG: N-acetylmuramoyl-L-alanine amidase [Gammaproteobacteria bacterium]|nr:N-acetylmuramoyl-L-alanine amidase [Gammaproteobacteria bacterium]
MSNPRLHYASLFCWLIASLAHVQAAEVQDLRLWRAPDHTRLVFDLSEAVAYQLFTLNNPERVVIDLEDSSLARSLGEPDFTATPVNSIRISDWNDETLRFVLDLGATVRPSIFSLAPNNEFGNRLVVDLYDLEPAKGSVSTQHEALPVASEKRDIVVAISAGHGGEDPGAIGFDGRIKEKDITLAISWAIYNRLASLPGFAPIMIREGDYYVELKRRPEIARHSRADLFIAIHADWFRTTRAKGVTIYALSGDRADRENSARVAEKENSSDLLGGVGGDLALGDLADDVALTLVSLQMSWSMEQSLLAGTRIIESLDGITHIRRHKVQQASLQVLNSSDIPSILVETGYLSNPEEARRLKTPGFQRRLAASMVQGIVNYFQDEPPQGTLIAWQKENGIMPGSYIVKSGDSLSVIAHRFGLTLGDLKAANQLRSNVIHIGQELRIPGDAPVADSEHTIRAGETLSEIAQMYRISLSSLRKSNNLSGDRILIGQVLKIPSL